MNSIKTKPLAILMVLTGLLYPQISEASDFTAADLMKQNPDNRAGYIQTSMGMMGVVLTRIDSRISNCIDNYLYDGNGIKPASIKEIEGVFERFPNYHPQAILLSWVRKNCGDFGS